jgi:hypothetical protein
MKEYGGSGIIASPFLTSTLDGGEWPTSRIGRFTPRERSPYTLWIGSSVGPRDGVNTVEKKRKSLAYARIRTPAVQSVAVRLYRLSYPGS